MTFGQALDKLNIRDYQEAIFHSNSHGELFHIYDYIELAIRIPDNDTAWFRPAFLKIVEDAKSWKRPQSIYQHVLKAIFAIEPDRIAALFPENIVKKQP